MMDYSNTYGLHTVGVYAVRFGYLAAWPLAELGVRMGGQAVDLAVLRTQFAQVLGTQRLAARQHSLQAIADHVGVSVSSVERARCLDASST